jgi:hypothetical protein
MLNPISWQQYILFLTIAVIIYYLSIWIIYYKAKLPSFSGTKNFRRVSLHGEDEPDEMMSTAQYIIEELRPVFQNTHNKNELIFSLQSQLKKYNHWDEPGFRDTINEFIATESEDKCSILLSEEDQRVLWMG